MLEIVTQVGITIFGICSIVLISIKNKWGFVFGLIAQPFWFITSYQNHQWGVFFLSFVYTFSWILGIYEWFYKNKPENEQPKTTEEVHNQ